MALTDPIMALRMEIPLSQANERVVPPSPLRLHYSAVCRTETPLPEELQPAAIGTRTGAMVVGDLVFASPSEIEQTVAGSVELVRTLAEALPVIKEDERMVDALMACRTHQLEVRPLRGRKV